MATEYDVLDVKSIPSLMGRENYFSFFAKVTSQVADEVLTDHNYDRQRAISRFKVKELVSFMNDGSFEPMTSTVNFSVMDGKVILTDGQHRMSAIREADKSYVFSILASNIDPDYIYPKTNRGKPRTLRDAIRSNRTAEAIGMTITQTNKAAVGLKVILGGRHVKYSRGEVNESALLKILVEEYQKPIRQIFLMSDTLQYGRRITGRIPMSLLLTLYKALDESIHEKIDNFIFGCASGIDLGDGDPRRPIYNMYASTGSVGTISKRTVSKKDELGILLSGWKYWYKGDSHKGNFSLSLLKKTLAESPNVEGTDITYKTPQERQIV